MLAGQTLGPGVIRPCRVGVGAFSLNNNELFASAGDHPISVTGYLSGACSRLAVPDICSIVERLPTLQRLNGPISTGFVLCELDAK